MTNIVGMSDWLLSWNGFMEYIHTYEPWVSTGWSYRLQVAFLFNLTPLKRVLVHILYLLLYISLCGCVAIVILKYSYTHTHTHRFCDHISVWNFLPWIYTDDFLQGKFTLKTSYYEMFTLRTSHCNMFTLKTS